jgi:hypothetical protein
LSDICPQQKPYLSHAPCNHSTSNYIPSHNLQDEENNVPYFSQMMSLTARATTSTQKLLFPAKYLLLNVCGAIKKVNGIYIKKSTKLKIMINSQLIFTVSGNYSSHVTACLKIILRIFL